MKLQKLYLKGFGKFLDREIRIANGLNIIYGKNETGKSTIHRFIEGVFFNFKKPDSPRRIWTPELDKFRPWNAREYMGFIIYEHHGISYRLERYFAKEKDQVRLFDELTGEELTYQFNEKSNQEREILEEQLGLTPVIYQNTISISQLAIKSGDELLKEVKSRLVNLAETGSEEIFINQAYKLLKEAVDRIGTERQTTKEHYKLLKQIEELKTEFTHSQEIYQSLQEEEAELSLIKEEQNELQKKIAEKQKIINQLAAARDYKHYQKVLVKKQELDEIAEELEVEQYLKDFPASIRDEIITLREKLQGQREFIQEIEQELAEKKSVLQKKRLIKEENKVFEGLTFDDLEQLKLAYSIYEDRLQTYLEAKIKEEKITAELLEKSKLVEEHFAAYADLTMGQLEEFEKKEDELKNTNRLHQLEYNIDRSQRKLSVLQGRLAGNRKILTFTGFAGLVVTAGGWIYPILLTGILPVLLFLFVKFRKGKRLHRDIKMLIQEQTGFLQQLEQNKSKITKIKYDLKEIYASYGVSSLGELRMGLMEYINLQKEKMMLEEQRSELKRQINEFKRLQTENGAIVKSYLSLIGEEELCSRTFTRLVDRLKLYLQQEVELTPLQDEIIRLERKQEENAEKHKQLQERKKVLLEQAGVKGIADFEEKYRHYLKYKEREEIFIHKQKELEALQEGKQVGTEKWINQLEIPNNLPDFNQEIYQQTEGELVELRERYFLLVREADIRSAEIETRLNQVRSPAELEEELFQAEKKRQENKVNLQALQIAEETIKLVSQQMHREYAPRLNALVGEVIKEITASRYERVRISSALDIRVLTKDGHSRELRQFSNGTIDQFYFAFRLASASLLTGNDQLPLFLDESFVQFDRSRLRNVLTFLGRLSMERQILLFTCHQRERELVEELGLKAHFINL